MKQSNRYATYCFAQGTIMTNLNELQFFVHVSQTQSFTKAAKRLGVPKSSVSRAIHRLESRLGVRLVERTTRKVSLTEVGELYLSRCRRVLEEAEQADLAVGALQAKPRGTLRVGAPVVSRASPATPTPQRQRVSARGHHSGRSSPCRRVGGLRSSRKTSNADSSGSLRKPRVPGES